MIRTINSILTTLVLFSSVSVFSQEQFSQRSAKSEEQRAYVCRALPLGKDRWDLVSGKYRTEREARADALDQCTHFYLPKYCEVICMSSTNPESLDRWR